MNILLVNSQWRLGGAETVVKQLRRGFPNSGLVVADGKTFPAHVQPLYPRWMARLHHSRLHGLLERLAPRAEWTDRAFRQLADAPCDLIHLHNFHGRYASVESLAYVARRKPVVWTFHALWGVTGGCDHPRDCRRYLDACGDCPRLGQWPLTAQDDTAEQLALKLDHLSSVPLHVIAPSRWLAEIVQSSRVGRHWHVHHIPNAVDAEFAALLEKTPQPARNEPTILIVNRNFRDAQKGFSIVQSALAEWTGLRPHLLLAGENSDWARECLSGWSCESFGYVSDPAILARLHRAADIFLFASPAENFPCVVLEAMAAGSCVVATPSGGVKEQLQDGVTGILAGDISGHALSAALRQAIDDGDLRRRVGEAARIFAAQEFGEAVFFERHQRLYAEILAAWNTRS